MKKIFLAILLTLMLVTSASAAVGLPDYLKPEGLPSASRGTEIKEVPEDYAASGIQYILGDIISILLLIAGGVAVLQILMNSFWMIVAAGKGETIDKAKRGLTWSIVGLIFVLLSYITIQLLVQFVIGVVEEPTSPQAQEQAKQ